MKTQTIQQKVEEIKKELTDKVDEYFPKIKPMGGNKGRGEAFVIIGIALARFTDLLTSATEAGRKEERERIEKEKNVRILDPKHIRSGCCDAPIREDIEAQFYCINCGKHMGGVVKSASLTRKDSQGK